MKNKENFIDLSSYFQDKLNLKDLSIEVLQYQRKFSLYTLFETYFYDLLKDYNLFGFQKTNRIKKKFFWFFKSKKKSKKNARKNILWNEFNFWKYFSFPTFDYTLVYAKNIFSYQKENVGFSLLENINQKRRGDIKEWRNKYLINRWWIKNDKKLYIEENDFFSYLPDDVILPKFKKVNTGDFVFTEVLSFGLMNFLKTDNIFLSKKIYVFKNNQKICLNLFFYYFFKSNAYLFENNVAHTIGCVNFTKHGFNGSWMIIPTSLKSQANYIKVFLELEKQISLLKKIKKKAKNLLYFLGQNYLDEKIYSLKDIVQRRLWFTISTKDSFDWFCYPRSDHLNHVVYPEKTITSGFKWGRMKVHQDFPYEFEIKKRYFECQINDMVISKIYSRTSNPYLINKINLYALSEDYASYFSKISGIETPIIFWSILGQNFYQKYENKWKKCTAIPRFNQKKFFNSPLKLISKKYYHLTLHLSNAYIFCTKNLKKYTDLRKDISLFLQNYTVIDFKTYESYIKDMILEANQDF